MSSAGMTTWRRQLSLESRDQARCIVSEPLSELQALWEPIPESTCLVIDHGKVESRQFKPEQV